MFDWVLNTLLQWNEKNLSFCENVTVNFLNKAYFKLILSLISGLFSWKKICFSHIFSFPFGLRENQYSKKES